MFGSQSVLFLIFWMSRGWDGRSSYPTVNCIHDYKTTKLQPKKMKDNEIHRPNSSFFSHQHTPTYLFFYRFVFSERKKSGWVSDKFSHGCSFTDVLQFFFFLLCYSHSPPFTIPFHAGEFFEPENSKILISLVCFSLNLMSFVADSRMQKGRADGRETVGFRVGFCVEFRRAGLVQPVPSYREGEDLRRSSR